MEKEESPSKFKNRQSSSLTYALHWKQKAKQRKKEIIRLEENLRRINILLPKLIFEKAVLKPTSCPTYAELCSDIKDILPTCPPAFPGDKEIKFNRNLINLCQEAFESTDELKEELRQTSAPHQEAELKEKEKWLNHRALGNLCFIGELFKQKMITEKIVHSIIQKLLGDDEKVCPAEENVEALCHLFKTIGQHLDGNINSKRVNDAYFRRLQDLSMNSHLELRLRVMVQNIIDLRSNGWILRREEVKVKTIIEIHYEAEKNLGIQPAIANNETSGADNDIWEVPRTGLMFRRDYPGPQHSPLMSKSTSTNTRLLPQGTSGFMSGRRSALLQGSSSVSSPVSAAAEPPAQVAAPSTVPVLVEQPSVPKLSDEVLKRKTKSLLEEYFSVRLLDEALQCVEELGSPSYHAEFVMEAISLSLEKSPPVVEPIVKLLEYLFTKKVVTRKDLETGFLLYGAMLDDIGIDLPKAPNNFGEILGKLILAGGVDFKLVREVLGKMEDDRFQKAVIDAAVRILESSEQGKSLLTSQAADIEASGADSDIWEWEVPRAGLMSKRDESGPQRSPPMSISKEEAAEKKNCIWPPTQKSRDAISNRLFETFSSKLLSYEEANSVSKTIEEEAYGVASKAVSSEDDGIKNLLLYAKEINKRLLVTFNDRSI